MQDDRAVGRKEALMSRLDVEFHVALILTVSSMTVAVAAAIFLPLLQIVGLAMLMTACATCWFVGVAMRMGIRW